MVDDREAKRLLADAEDVGHADRGEPEDRPGEHRLRPVRDGHAPGEAARVEDGAHVETATKAPPTPMTMKPRNSGAATALIASTRKRGGRSKTTLATTWPAAAATVIGANARSE